MVTVDPSNGNDSSCLSAQELLANQSLSNEPGTPCATLNRALGDVACGINSSCVVPASDQLDGVVIVLADGLHRLTGKCKK